MKRKESLSIESQAKAIKKELLAGGKITPIDALRKFGCFRLSARIFDLRKEGLAVKSTFVETKNKRYKMYYL